VAAKFVGQSSVTEQLLKSIFCRQCTFNTLRDLVLAHGIRSESQVESSLITYLLTELDHGQIQRRTRGNIHLNGFIEGGWIGSENRIRSGDEDHGQ
jgi:hypothetical protein